MITTMQDYKKRRRSPRFQRVYNSERGIVDFKPTSTPKPLFSWAECQKIKNVCFACMAYEAPEGLLFKTQAKELIEKLQPVL